MKKRKYISIILSVTLAVATIIVCTLHLVIQGVEYGFAREVSSSEQALRMQVIRTAESWLGSRESDGTHQPIVDIYNNHEPLAQDYIVQYDDNWCATFGSTVAIQCSLTDIIPTECGCERQIKLFTALGRWEEADNYVPLPGDYIFYCTTNKRPGDCTAWSDHVGIVVGTWHGYIKVIEGNNGDQVAYRYIPVNDLRIRGFGLPDYAAICTQ